MNFKPILLNLSVPITTPRLVLRPPQVGDGVAVNEAVLESIDTLRQFMPWAKEKPSIDDSEEFVRQAAANWIFHYLCLKKIQAVLLVQPDITTMIGQYPASKRVTGLEVHTLIKVL
jgi:hypothetical protein